MANNASMEAHTAATNSASIQITTPFLRNASVHTATSGTKQEMSVFQKMSHAKKNLVKIQNQTAFPCVNVSMGTFGITH